MAFSMWHVLCAICHLACESKELSLLLLSPIHLSPPSFSLALSHSKYAFAHALLKSLFQSDLFSKAFLIILLIIESPMPLFLSPYWLLCFVFLQNSHYHATSSIFCTSNFSILPIRMKLHKIKIICLFYSLFCLHIKW